MTENTLTETFPLHTASHTRSLKNKTLWSISNPYMDLSIQNLTNKQTKDYLKPGCIMQLKIPWPQQFPSQNIQGETRHKRAILQEIPVSDNWSLLSIQPVARKILQWQETHWKNTRLPCSTRLHQSNWLTPSTFKTLLTFASLHVRFC